MRKKIILVSGGTGDIGKCIIDCLVSGDCFVYFTYHTNEENARQLMNQYGSEKIKGFQCDITDHEAVKQVVADITAETDDTIDVLINAAGITKDKNFLMMDDDIWHTVINVNLHGVYNVTRSVIFFMLKKKSGSIINLSSVSGIIGMAGQTNYAASKAAIIGFSKALAREVSPRGVRVNVVAPGFIESAMTAKLNPKYLENTKKDILLGRLGKPGEITGIVRYLASDDSSYTTGQVFIIDGGIAL